ALSSAGPWTCPSEARGHNLQSAVERLVPRERACTGAAAIGAAWPGQGRRDVHEADAAAGSVLVLGANKRVVERGVAQIGAGIARDECRDAALVQPRHDVAHRQARGQVLGPALADGSDGGQSAGRILRCLAGVARALLDLEAAGARGN